MDYVLDRRCFRFSECFEFISSLVCVDFLSGPSIETFLVIQSKAQLISFLWKWLKEPSSKRWNGIGERFHGIKMIIGCVLCVPWSDGNSTIELDYFQKIFMDWFSGGCLSASWEHDMIIILCPSMILLNTQSHTDSSRSLMIDGGYLSIWWFSLSGKDLKLSRNW